MKFNTLCLFFFIAFLGCNAGPETFNYYTAEANSDTQEVQLPELTASHPDRTAEPKPESGSGGVNQQIEPGAIKADQLVDFAESLNGIPYKYGSLDPQQGFDCSGFITYVFNKFNIQVPRSSIEFTNLPTEIDLKDAVRGDIILFTGTDSTIREVGHMGIITSAGPDGHHFIHSTSGKAYGVTITPLNPYYEGRFVKTIRFFR